MKEQEFYICNHCGNIIAKVLDACVPVVCCGENMVKLEPNTVDAANEKHLPVVELKDNIVKVNIGAVAHPMTEKHLIQWIYLQTEHGGQRKNLTATDKPEVSFALADGDKAYAVFSYCNLHGLWETKI